MRLCCTYYLLVYTRLHFVRAYFHFILETSKFSVLFTRVKMMNSLRRCCWYKITSCLHTMNHFIHLIWSFEWDVLSKSFPQSTFTCHCPCAHAHTHAHAHIHSYLRRHHNLICIQIFQYKRSNFIPRWICCLRQSNKMAIILNSHLDSLHHILSIRWMREHAWILLLSAMDSTLSGLAFLHSYFQS